MFCFVFNLATPGLSWGRWDLVPRPGIESERPALAAQSLRPWTPGTSCRGPVELSPEESEEALGGFARWSWQGPARAKSE